MFFKMSNVELVNKFKVTKALIEAYVNNGFTVRQMGEDITKQSGVKCTDAVVRQAAKTYGINLRLKKMPSHFVFEDLSAVGASDPTPLVAKPVEDVNTSGLPVVVEVVYDSVEGVI